MSTKQPGGVNRVRPARLGVVAAFLALLIMALTLGSTQASGSYVCWDGLPSPPLGCPTPPPLDIDVTLNAENSRTHYWEIDAKDTNIGSYDSSFVHTYRIRVSHRDEVERVMVSGTIAITNNWLVDADITGVRDMVTESALNDPVYAFAEATVDCPVSFPYLLPAGQGLSCTFTVPAPTLQLHFNRAIVSTKGIFTSSSVDTPIMFGPLTDVNDEITVKLTDGDTIDEQWNVSGNATLTYDHEFFCDDDEGVNVATASILETGQSNDAIVTIDCADDAHGLLTLVKDTTPAGGTGFEFSFDPVFLNMWTFASGPADPLNPTRLDVDSDGNVYVASYDNRVVKYDNDGAYLGQWGSPGSGPGQFNSPLDVAIDGDNNVYVLDYTNSNVQKFNTSGVLLDTFGGSGGGKGQFSDPLGLAVDAAGNVYVADSGNDRISIFDSQGDFVAMWGKDVLAGNAETGFEICTSAPADTCQGDDEGSGDGELWAPQDVAVDSAGNVYVADTANARIQKFSAAGEFLTAWGQVGVGDGEFQTVIGLGIDARDYVYATDWALHRVQKFTGDGTYLATWAGTDPGTDPGQFNEPLGIAFDANNNAFVSEQSGARVQKFVAAGARLDDEQSVTFQLLPATYTITEILPDGWSWEDNICVGGSLVDNITSIDVEVDSGDDIVCTFYNETIENVADLDGVDDAIEAGAPNGGDGNNDGIPDAEQNNVASLPNAETGQYVTVVYAGLAGALGSVSTDRSTDVTNQPLPTGVTTPLGTVKTRVPTGGGSGLRGALFGLDALALVEPDSVWLTLFFEGNPTFDSYYKFGPTPDNPTPHWYEFLYDGQTGAELLSDRIILHFVDGGRGDSDLRVNGVIDDPGGPVVFTDAELTVIKEVTGSAPADWSFNVGAPGLSPAGLTLTDDDPGHTYIDVAPGEYTLTETDLPGWVPSVSCLPNGDTGSNAVTVDLAAGDFATCRFTNAACSPGTYDDGTACVETDPGHFTATPLSVAQQQCAPGSFQPYEGQPGCFEAEEGTYAPGPAATEQTACPSGTTSPAGSDSVDDCVPVTSAPVALFFSAKAAGTTGDGVQFGSEDILKWDGSEWSRWFDGSAAGLTAAKAVHNLNAIWIEDDAAGRFVASFAQNRRAVPGIVPKVDGTDLVRWDGSAFSLWFDGSDVGLTNLVAEKIDGLHVLDGSASPINGGSCVAYVLVSTQGLARVPKFGGGTLTLGGEDVAGFCATSLGENTAGFWHMVLDGSTQGMPKNSTDSISLSDDGQTLYLTTKATFNVDSAAGGHSMVYAYDMTTQTFSGPVFSAPAEGLPQKVDGLQVEGDLP